MAAPSVAAWASGGTTTTDTTSHAITLPTGITSGQLLIVIFSVDGNPTCTTTSTGWRKLDQASNSNLVTGAVFYKIATGSDSLTITTSVAEQSTHVSARIPDGGMPLGASANGSSTNSDPPAHDTGYSQEYLWLATRSGDSNVVATVAPASYSNLQTQTASGTGGASTNVATRANTVSSENPGTFTSVTEQWVSWTLSIPPAAVIPQTVVDNFNDNSLSGSWQESPSGSGKVSEAGSQLRIKSGATSGTQALNRTSSSLSNGKYYGCKLINAGDQTIPSLEVTPIRGYFTDGSMFWKVNGGNLQAWTDTGGGTLTQRGVSLPYPSTLNSISGLTIVDSFSDNSIGAEWTSSGTGVSETSRQLQITTANATRYVQRLDQNAAFLNGKYVGSKLVNAGTANANNWAYPISIETGSLKVQWVVNNGTLLARYNTGGGDTTAFSVSWNSSTMAYLGIRRRTDNNDIEWAYSSDGVTWTSAHTQNLTAWDTVTTSDTISYFLLSFATGSFGTVIFDDFFVYDPAATTVVPEADTNFKYVAVGVEAGQIRWLVSPDGSTWRVHYSMANPFGSPNGTVSILVGTTASESTVTLAAFDDYSTWMLPFAQGNANVGLGMALGASGSTKHAGTSNIGLNFEDLPIGQAEYQGSADVGLDLFVAGEGDDLRPPSGTADVLLVFGDLAEGTVEHSGSADVTLSFDLKVINVPSGLLDASFNLDIEVVGAAVTRLIPVRVLSPREILTGNRITRYVLEVLDLGDNPVTTLDGVTDGNLEWVANAAVKGGGSIKLEDVNQQINWLTARLRPIMRIEGLPDQPLGVFLPSEAPESWDKGRTWAIKLLDKTDILNQDTVASTYALGGGSVITDKIEELIESAGIFNHAITPSAATLPNGMIWEAGTSKLAIINDLLHLLNYFSLYSNFEGQMVGEPYVLPANRPIVYQFFDGEESIYSRKFQRDVDIWSIPNRVTAIGMGSGATEALTSTLDNTDPLSPYSIVSRGNRVIGHVERGVEVASQTILDSYVRRRLVELTTPTAIVRINHAPVPGLAVNQTVHFRRVPAGIDHRHTVSKTSLRLKGKSLATSSFREVVDL